MRLVIIGASGHGRVVADIARLNGYDDIVFLDDNENVVECSGYPVVGKSTDAPDGEVFIAIGNSRIRKMLSERYADRVQPVLCHPKAIIAADVTIGKGPVVMAGAVINPGAAIGAGVIVNTSSSIDHDCVIGDYAHISVGAHLSGSVIVGNETWIGAGAVVSNNVTICGGCIIGAGGAVIRNIDAPGTYVGVPVRKLSESRAQTE